MDSFSFLGHTFRKKYSPQSAGQRTSQNESGVRKVQHRSSGRINPQNSKDFRDGSNGTSPGTWKWLKIMKNIGMASLLETRGFYEPEVTIIFFGMHTCAYQIGWWAYLIDF